MRYVSSHDLTQILFLLWQEPLYKPEGLAIARRGMAEIRLPHCQIPHCWASERILVACLSFTSRSERHPLIRYEYGRARRRAYSTSTITKLNPYRPLQASINVSDIWIPPLSLLEASSDFSWQTTAFHSVIWYPLLHNLRLTFTILLSHPCCASSPSRKLQAFYFPIFLYSAVRLCDGYLGAYSASVQSELGWFQHQTLHVNSLLILNSLSYILSHK